MNTKRIAIIIVAGLLLGAGIAGAADYGNDTSEDLKISKEKQLSQKATQDEKKTNTKRTTKNKQKGKDITESTSRKQTGSFGENDGLDVSMTAQSLFPELPLEPPYLLPADFGWTGREGRDVINTTKADFFRNQAASNAPLDDEEQAKIQAYILQILKAGGRTGEAIQVLQRQIAKLGKVTKDKTGEYVVRGLGKDDVVTLASGAMKATADKITDKWINAKMDSITKNPFPACRWQGELTAIQCGKILVHLASPPVLKLDMVEWFRLGESGGGSFAGVSGTFKVSSSWSYSQALEDAKGDSKFTKIATEASTAAERMESEGRTFDAVMTKKKAIDSMTANKAGMGPKGFLPSVH